MKARKDLLTEEDFQEAYSELVFCDMIESMRTLNGRRDSDHVYKIAKTLFTDEEIKKAADAFFESYKLFVELQFYVMDEMEEINNEA